LALIGSSKVVYLQQQAEDGCLLPGLRLLKQPIADPVGAGHENVTGFQVGVPPLVHHLGLWPTRYEHRMATKIGRLRQRKGDSGPAGLEDCSEAVTDREPPNVGSAVGRGHERKHEQRGLAACP
jgi:hypothetical protein